MPNKKTKVLYLAGWGRSGSTILSNILGEVDGFCAVGEINNLWQRGILENKLCGCGRPFAECEFWQQICDTMFDSQPCIDARQVLALRNKGQNFHTLFSFLPGGSAYLASNFKHYALILEEIFRALQQTTNSQVIVDASKNPLDGYFLSMIPNIDLHIVHLIRDPRGVAYSWQKNKSYDNSETQIMYMDSYGSLYSTLIWTAWNATIELLWKSSPKYLRLHYEDLMQEPKATVKKIVEFCGEPSTNLPFVSETEVLLQVNHNVSGNPSRFVTGFVPLRQDDEWKERLRPRDKIAINTLFAPFLHHYGY